MRPIIRLPYTKTSAMHHFMHCFLLFIFLSALNSNPTLAKSIAGDEYCLWSLEKDAGENSNFKLSEEISISSFLIDVVPAVSNICAGQSIQFSLNDVDPTYTYEWSATDGSFDDINSATPIYTVLSAGTYSVVVIVTDQNNNNLGFFDAAVNVTPPISVSVTTAGQDCTQLGSINLNLSGGTGNYGIDWQDLLGTNDPEDRNNLTAGTYTVNVTDDNGCVQNTDIVVPQLCNVACPASAGTITPDEGFLCVPGSFIAVDATPDGNAVVPAGFELAYLFTSGANSLILQTGNTPSFIVTTEGAYTIHPFVYDPATFDFNSIIVEVTTLQDVNAQLQQAGGTVCASLDLNGATTLTDKAIGLVVTSTPETCDAENGQVILAPPSNSFLWFDGFTGNERNDLADGTYIVTVSESTGCSGEIQVTVDEVCQCPVTPTAENIVIVEATCGNANGTATLEMVGNNNDYTYTWNPPISTTNVAQNLTAGSYSVLITEVGNATCFSIENFVVGNADGPQVTIDGTSPANCTAPNGSATLTPNTLNYQWCDGGTGASRNDLMAGSCPVTVTDPNTGCINVIEVFIQEINNLTAEAAVGTPPTCGGADGVASILVSGGTGTYSYAWNDGGNSATRFGLAAGPYVVTVTDDTDGCTVVESFTLISSADGATVTIDSDVVLNCSGDANGTVVYSTQFSGGFTQPATELIRDAFGNNMTNGNLTAGSYCVLVFDANNCLAGEGCFEVSQPDVVTVDVAITNQTCAQLGAINILAIGGSNSFTFDWADLAGGNNPQNRTGLTAGTYDLTATDANGCAASVSVTVADNCTSPICSANAGTLSINSNSICLVSGSANLVATPLGNAVVPSGYSVIYVLTSGGIIQTTNASPDFTVSSIGDYVLHTLVYDPSTLDLSNITPMVTTAQDVVSLLIQGGGSICASLDVNGGAVSVITCGGGTCTTPPQISNITKLGSNCGQATGSASVNVVGNNNDYTFSFSAGNATGNFVNGLASGTYTVTITDTGNADCVLVEDFSITNADGPQVTIISTSPTSCATSNGSAQLSPPNFNYLWCDNGTGSVRNDLPSGMCPVTVTDPATGCTNIVEVEIPAQSLLQVTPIINNNPDCGMANGVVVLQITGGSNNYTFEWSDANSINNAIRNDLPGGTFGVTVTDNGPNACVGTATFTLTEDVVGTATVVIQSVSPVACIGDANGVVNYTVTEDAGFVQPASERIIDAAGNFFANNFIPAGDYCVEIRDGNNCVAGSECFTVGAPDPILVDISAFPTTCAQGGSITLTASGGSGSYSYDWDDLGGNNDPQNRIDLSTGTYGVTVTDNSSCTAFVNNIEIVDGCSNCLADAGTLQADSTDICFDGTPLTISATGANAAVVPAGYNTIYVLTIAPVFEILQVNSIPEFSINALGNYRIHTLVFDPTTLNPNDYTNAIDLNEDLLQGGGTICAALDVNGAAVAVINCAPCTAPQIQNIVTIEATCGNADGSATITVAGTGTYAYQWSAGSSTTNSTNGLAAGTYTVTITDATNVNCTSVETFIIGNADGPPLSIFSQTPTSCNANNGTAVLEPQTNLFEWDDNGNGAIRTDLSSGINIVTVTDPATNCINVYEIFIESVQSLEIQANVIQQPDCQVANGEVDLTITGGSTNYTYIWSDDATANSANRTNLAGGSYGVTVIDNGPNACVDSISFVLLDNIAAGATINIFNPNNQALVSCAGNADGEVDYSVTLDAGFAGPAVETIFDGNGMMQTNGQLAPGNYCLIVTDVAGCVAGESCFEVIDPDPITVNIEVTNATCTDLGRINTFATGGTGFLLFDWADLPNSSDPQNRFGLSVGIYSLTVTDQSGCTVVVDNILVQDDCNTDCPTSSEESLIIPINTLDSFCVTLDTCFVDSLTTYSLLGGGTSGSSVFGSWNLTSTGCLEYTSNDSSGAFIDTICVLSNFNVLTDTTCIIVTVLPECGGGADIFSEDSISLVIDDCAGVANYCSEIELAQILNFTLTDNGQPYATPLEGCNFDTTFFYSLAAYLNVAPVGPYTVTSWDSGNGFFSIDSLQDISVLVDSMAVWDPAGNWVLNGAVISGGASGVNYGALNIIQLNTGASTNLDVDFNQIPNGTAITLDTGFHELIILDLITGCSDTLFAEVSCDDCPTFYSGASTVIGDDCNGNTDLCLDIPLTDFLFNFEVIDNGLPYGGIRKGCGFDTLSTCYIVSVLPDAGSAGPYSINQWELNGITFASDFNDLDELLTLMNGWDPTGNWVLDTAALTICGGAPGADYGQMEVTQTNTGAIAMLEPDYVVLTFASAIELDTGFHQIILTDTLSGCTDTLEIMVDCDVVVGGVDTLLEVMVSTTDTLCFNLTDTIVSAVNLCPDLSDGNVAGFNFIPNTNCIEYTGAVIGLDTFCMVFELADGTFDTTGIVIEVVPQLLSGDTIPVSVLINFTETFCLDTAAFLAPLDTIYNYCESASGEFSEVMIIEPNCIDIMGFSVGMLDTACIVICDTTGFCDTTIFLIEITRPGIDSVFETAEIGVTDTFCPDTSQLFGTLISIENICDSLSGNNASFAVDTANFCLDYTTLDLGADTACLVICDDLGICDTTIYVLTVINPIDTLIAVDDDTSTFTINPVTIDVFANDVFDPATGIYGIVTAANNGTVVTNPDGSFTYLAEAGFCGALDSFSYYISDGILFDTATVIIDVLCDDIKVFNGFSPNNDGINETLVIQGIENFNNNEVYIFNRWGNRVFYEAGYSNAEGWAGTFEGKDLPDGTYFYIIEDGEGGKYTGWLQISR